MYVTLVELEIFPGEQTLGVWGDESPQWGPGQRPGEIWGAREPGDFIVIMCSVTRQTFLTSKYGSRVLLATYRLIGPAILWFASVT